VFAGNPKALLGISDPVVLGFLMSQKIGFELVHSRIGEHQCGIVLNHHWGRGYNGMGFGLKKL
jgi:hypothetical protein